MKKALENILNTKKFIIAGHLIEVAQNLKLSLDEFLMLVFFDNNYSKVFDLNLVCQTININEKTALDTFNSLMQKKLITLKTVTDSSGRMNEEVSLDGIYEFFQNNFEQVVKEETKTDIYTVFEKEFGRTLSSMDLEIINGWLATGTTEEMVLGALKEAVYNGVTSLRYIDKIIYEWGKKGFKTMADVKVHLEKQKEDNKPTKNLFDYNWIEDDEQ
ncbi:MAG TPA: DnaD domain protein [Bacilli bacterium]|nr:DnaD domain protein [Bacilli bacterium]